MQVLSFVLAICRILDKLHRLYIFSYYFGNAKKQLYKTSSCAIINVEHLLIFFIPPPILQDERQKQLSPAMNFAADILLAEFSLIFILQD